MRSARLLIRSSTGAVAIRDRRIEAVSAVPAGLDAAVGPETRVLETSGRVVPGMIDTHNHLMLAARNRLGAPVASAASIPDLLERIQARAEATEPGRWVVTGADWHEMRLAERRLPTVAELDAASGDRPTLVQRGGHIGVLNSAALAVTGLHERAVDGRVEESALHVAQSYLPAPDPHQLDASLARTSRQYAMAGLAAVRDPAVSPAEWQAYRRCRASGQLAVRASAMIFTTRAAIQSAGSFPLWLDSLEAAAIHPGSGDDMLNVWGVKLVLDGGVEAAALTADYHDRPGYRGDLLWSIEELVAMFTSAAERGWPVGVHALGDRAVAKVIEALERVSRRRVSLPERGFVLEHGGLIDSSQRQRLVDLSVPVTAQQALLDALSSALLPAWGPERVAALFPWRGLIDDGVEVSAGTDHPIGPLSPMRAIYGMTTRNTGLGCFGPEHSIRRDEALRLYSAAGAPLVRLGLTGAVHTGSPADLAIYDRDPLTCADSELSRLEPSRTIVDGWIVE